MISFEIRKRFLKEDAGCCKFFSQKSNGKIEPKNPFYEPTEAVPLKSNVSVSPPDALQGKQPFLAPPTGEGIKKVWHEKDCARKNGARNLRFYAKTCLVELWILCVVAIFRPEMATFSDLKFLNFDLPGTFIHGCSSGTLSVVIPCEVAPMVGTGAAIHPALPWILRVMLGALLTTWGWGVPWWVP